jgi:bifunctional DNA-binding transcriptional regulator/antitoxin component of YhaV-PrlF toxin-antitoxin module
MSQPPRIRIAPDGTLKLPRDVTEKLGWATGSYLEVSVKGDQVQLKKVEVDVFAEAVKKPDEDAFDKILKKQKESTEKAFKDFEVKIKDPPPFRPEDQPQFWD